MNEAADTKELTSGNGASSAPTLPDASDPFEVPLPSIEGGVYRMFMEQDSFTPEEREAWDDYLRRCEEAERKRNRLGLVDLGAVMEDGATEPTMLVERLLVEGDHHLVYGTKESGKTWLVLRCAVGLIQDGLTVVWADKEMGRKNIADRLASLEAEPEAVSERFVYLEHPILDLSSESRTLWETLLRLKQPALVVFDAQTELLADAGLNENMGTDIEKWSQPYVTPARRLGVTTLMIDHTGHSEAGRAVASRQKGAAAKVELSVTRDKPFGRDSVGRITMRVTKNTVAAPIPGKQRFRIGGDEGGFVFEEEPESVDAGEESAKAERRQKVQEAIVKVLREQGGELSQRNLAQLAKAEADVRMSDSGDDGLNAIAAAMARSDRHPVRVQQGPRGSLLYRYESRD